MDRQRWRIVCERGEIRLNGWVPETLVVDALLKEGDVEALSDRMGGAGVTRLAEGGGDRGGAEAAGGAARGVTARHKRFEADGRYHLRALDPRDKNALYGHALRALLVDQARAIRDPSHVRRVEETHALASLELAAAAARRAG